MLSPSLHVALIDTTCFLWLLRDVADLFSPILDLVTIWLCMPFRFLVILVSSQSLLPRFLSLPLSDPAGSFLADQVDTTRNLSRFSFTLDEMLATAQLASFDSSDSDVLKRTRHKVLRQIETQSVSLSTDLINNTATQLFKEAARAGSALASDDTFVLTNTVCAGCKKVPGTLSQRRSLALQTWQQV